MTIKDFDNILLFRKSPEAEKLCTSLGFSSTLFSENVVFIQTENRKTLLRESSVGKRNQKIVIFSPRSEELLRFALEHTPVDIILGIENIHPKDSVHYLRSGIDRVLGPLIAEKEKRLGFSFSAILNSPHPERFLARMKYNLELCKKYKIKTFFGNFSARLEEIRSKKDLSAFQLMLESDRT